MAPLGFFRSNPTDRTPTSPTPPSPSVPSYLPFSERDRGRLMFTSPPPSPTKRHNTSISSVGGTTTTTTPTTTTTSSNRIRRFKSGSFSFGRSESSSHSSSLKGTELNELNELEDDFGRRIMIERTPDCLGNHIKRVSSNTNTTTTPSMMMMKKIRPRGVSESSGDRIHPRMWFSRHKPNNSSALSDDEDCDQQQQRPRGNMIISNPMPPIDGRPIKSLNVMEDLADLQCKLMDSSMIQTTKEMEMEMETDRSTLSCPSSLIKLEQGIENFKRPVTPPPPSAPPSTLRIQSTGKLTPLSPLKRNLNRTWKSPHLTPLVFQQNTTTNPPPQPNSSSCERSPASASTSVASSITRINSTGSSDQIIKSDKSNSPSEHLIAPLKPMPPSPGRSNLKYWPNRRPSIEFTSSSSPPHPQGQLAQPFVHSAPPPRSISSDTSISARSSPTSPPESISLEGQETEELTTFDDSEDSAVGIMLTSSINDYRKESGDDETISRNTMTTIPGYSIDIVCSENLSSDAGDNGGEDFETIKWQVIIRKAKSLSTPLPAPTSPIALSRGSTTVIPPQTASSINLSLALDRPSGKLVFISLPVATPQQTTSHQRTRSKGGISGAKCDPDSPLVSSTRSRSPGVVRPLSVSTDKPTAVRSPFYADDTFSQPTLSSPPPLSSTSPRLGRFPSQRRKAPQQILPGSPLYDLMPDSPRLVTPRSPPASPRDILIQRRKASLQDGVLFTPELLGYGSQVDRDRY